MFLGWTIETLPAVWSDLPVGHMLTPYRSPQGLLVTSESRAGDGGPIKRSVSQVDSVLTLPRD